MSVLPNLINRFNAMPIKIQASNFMDMEKQILKFTWKGKTNNNQNNIEEEEETWRTNIIQLQDL